MAPPSPLERVSGARKAMLDKLLLLGDVGDTEESVLRKILPLCSRDQLEHIESCTKKNGRDLTSVTNELWQSHYARRFGEEHATWVTEQLALRSGPVSWRKIFKAKIHVEETSKPKEGVDRLRELYQQESAKKESRRIHVIHKPAPDSRKRANPATLPSSAGSAAGPSSKKPARAKAPAPLQRGMTSDQEMKQKEEEEEEEREKERRRRAERGRLWKKSLMDLAKHQKLLNLPFTRKFK